MREKKMVSLLKYTQYVYQVNVKRLTNVIEINSTCFLYDTQFWRNEIKSHFFMNFKHFDCSQLQEKNDSKT